MATHTPQRDAFLKAIIGEALHYYVFKDREGKIAGQRLTNLLGATDLADAASTLHDVYISLADYTQVLGTDTKRKRGPESVTGCRSILFDLDAQGRDYDSHEQAMQAMVAWMQARAPSMLAASTWVNTGGGLHVIVSMDRPVPRIQWDVLTRRISDLSTADGLKADRGALINITINTRLPGSVNQKWGRNVEVVAPDDLSALVPVNADKLMDEMAALLPEPVGLELATMVAGNSGTDLSTLATLNDIDTGSLSKGVDQYPPFYMAEIVKSCGVMDHILQTGGSTCNEPQWFATLGVCTRAKDGMDYAVRMSNKHPSFSDDEFARKLSALEATKDRTGPTSCAKFGTMFPAICAACKFNGKVKSPVSLGNPHKLPSMPPGYRWVPGALERWEEVEGQTAHQWVRVCQYDVEVLHMQLIETPENGLTLVPVTKDGPQNNRHLLLKAMPTASAAKAHVASRGFQARDPHALSVMGQYIPNHKPTRVAQQIGFISPAHPEHGFAHPDGLITAHDVDKTNILDIDDSVFQTYSSCGDPQMWVDTVAKYVSHTKAAQHAIIALSFAAPLVSVLNVPAAVLSAESGASGTGKTTSAQLGTLAWGNRVDAMHGIQDTLAATMIRMSNAGSAPSYWDEVLFANGNESHANDFVETLIFQAVQGRDKHRGRPDAGLRKTGKFSTIMCVLSNMKLSESIALIRTNSNSASLRLLEIVVDRVDPWPTELIAMDSKIAQLNDGNYGKPAIIYIQHVLKNLPRVKKTLLELHAALCTAWGSDYRYIASLVACILTAATLVEECLFIPFDTVGIMELLTEAVRENRMMATVNTAPTLPTDPVRRRVRLHDMLNEFLAEHPGSVLVSPEAKPRTTRGKPPSNQNMAYLRNDAQIVAAVGTKDNYLVVSAGALQSWCNKKRYPWRPFLDENEERGIRGATVIQSSIGWGSAPAVQHPHVKRIVFPGFIYNT